MRIKRPFFILLIIILPVEKFDYLSFCNYNYANALADILASNQKLLSLIR